MKRVQNIVAESRRTLPFTAAYAVVVWLLAGLIGHGMWLQFVCFVLSVFMMVQLNNKNLLIRIYSRLVSSSYIALSCAALFLFDSPLSEPFFGRVDLLRLPLSGVGQSDRCTCDLFHACLLVADDVCPL